MVQDPLFPQIRRLLEEGFPDESRSLAQSLQTKDHRDPALHLAWADLLEELGLMEEVILELLWAIRDDPDGQEAYRRLAEIYLDQGQPLNAARV